MIFEEIIKLSQQLARQNFYFNAKNSAKIIYLRKKHILFNPYVNSYNEIVEAKQKEKNRIKELQHKRFH
jgi:archaellum component FlaF (FlaF/FlaG flagellin family)